LTNEKQLISKDHMKKIQKPISLYVMTIVLVIFVGILPFFGVLLQITGSEDNIPFTLVFVSLLLPAFSAASAIFAYTGYNEGRIAVLTCVSLSFLWWVFWGIVKVSQSGAAEALNGAFLILGLVRPVAFFALFWWYFTKKDVVAYFKRDA
jgi:hypothetical protein